MFDKNKYYSKEDIKSILIKENINCDVEKKAKEIYLIIQNAHRNERNSNVRNKKIKILGILKTIYKNDNLYIKNNAMKEIVKKGFLW
jgi:hypothetical protein